MADRIEWARRVAAWRRSGETAAEYARGREFAASTLKWWSSQLKALAAPPEPEPSSMKVAMIRVQRDAPREMAIAVVELDDAVVRIASGADEATLTALFGALRAGGAR